MTLALVIITGLVVLGCAFLTWTLLASGSWADEAHEAEQLRRLAQERARHEMHDRLQRLLRESRGRR